MNRTIGIILLLLLSGCGQHESKMNTVSIHYIPIGHETFEAIDFTKIVELATNHCDCESDVASELYRFWDKSSDGEFDREIIRVKAVFDDGKTMYIDNEGGLLFEGHERKIDEKTLERVKRLIEKACVN